MRLDVNRQWYRPTYTLVTGMLLPLSWIFHLVVLARRFLYRIGLKKVTRFPVPVIVVGNITIGGTGKTPFVIWLAEYLKSQGWNPGVVSRGYGSMAHKLGGTPNPAVVDTDTGCRFVTVDSDPSLVGDEAVLLAQRTQCPMVVGADRVAAVAALLAQHACDIVISDDGLQHYRLGRDIEIALLDGSRRLGNGALLPAGPLRESASRLQTVDFVVTQQHALNHEAEMVLSGDTLVSLLDSTQTSSIATWANKRVHAVAAIGNPDRFFASLRLHNLDVIEHVFPDHHLYQAGDLNFQDNLPIIMTEKDAVKCIKLADQRFWVLPVQAQLSAEFVLQLSRKLRSLMPLFF